jgi:hypothetical protein
MGKGGIENKKKNKKVEEKRSEGKENLMTMVILICRSREEVVEYKREEELGAADEVLQER